MKYSDHVDYLVASVIYLATQRGWWARTPSAMAGELSLDENRLLTVFEGFPGLFRRSKRVSPNGQHYYSLQARYAQRDEYQVKEEVTDIFPLETDKIRLIYDFILKSADDERTGRRWLVGNSIAVCAAVISAATAVIVAYLKA
ncbi:MAG TPA: hypothetical protein VFZ91_04405 [Allosphingosinicella sp.]